VIGTTEPVPRSVKVTELLILPADSPEEKTSLSVKLAADPYSTGLSKNASLKKKPFTVSGVGGTTGGAGAGASCFLQEKTNVKKMAAKYNFRPFMFY